MRAASPVISLSFAGCLLASAPVHGMGFGRVANSTELGQPLDFSAVVKLDADESLARECVFAEVVAGDSRVPPALVRVSFAGAPGEGERLVRVSTSTPIDEPVVTVNVTLGCTSKVTRQFVAFVDPPGSALSPAAPAPAVAPAAAAPVVADVAPVRERPLADAAVPRREASPQSATGRVAAAADPVRRSPRPAAVRTATTSAGPRLQLDAPAVAVAVASTGAAPVPVAASAPPVAPPVPVAAAASVGDEQAALLARERKRIESLEDEMARLRAESKAQQKTLAALQLQVGTTRSQRYANPLVYTLAALCLLMTTVVCGLLGRRSRDRAAARWLTSTLLARSAEPATVAGVAAVVPPSEQPLSRDGDAPPQATPAAGPVRASTPAPAVTGPQPAGAVAAARAPAVEELIDLEQQADFFVVLGQDDAAIELLNGHVDREGGASPIPLLKLLELHRRAGDRGEYDRIRARIDARFNARTPDFDADPVRGARLDEQPAVIARLQALWSAPAQARDALDALVFRRGASAEAFDLPAFRDLLFLRSIANDHVAHGGADVARPLDVDLSGASTRPAPTRAPPAPGKPLPVLTAAASQFDHAETLPSALRRLPGYANESSFVDLELEFPSLATAASVPR